MNLSILTAPEVIFSSALLEKFQLYTVNSEADVSDLFSFLTTPTAEREEFFALYCDKSYSSIDQVIIQKVNVK